MAVNNEDTSQVLKNSYLAACQTLQFSKLNKPNTEIADIERRCLFTKYMVHKNNINEDAVSLIQYDLENYANLVDSQSGLNNYWKQFNSLNVNTDNNPLEWKSNLSNVETTLEFLKPLPCNVDKTLPCKNEQCNDQDIKKLMDLWKNGVASPKMKNLPSKESTALQNKVDSSKVKDKGIKRIFSSTVTVNENVHKAQNSEVHKKHNVTSIKQNFNFEKGHKYITTNVRTNSNIQICDQNKSNFIMKKEQISADKKETDENKFLNFKTARTVMREQVNKNRQPINNNKNLNIKKSLGGKALNAPYVCPLKDNDPVKEEEIVEQTDERLKNIEPKMIELIRNEIMDCSSPISWDDIAGLDHAKRIIKEIVVFPMLRPDIFTGLRRPPKGILLFGPPGTGKTLIGKCIASQCKSTFFSISASSLTSKWIGEGEKMVRALFAVAQVEQPSVVFIDEIDSLLCQRSETEHESSRRMKTEFLVQLDGAATGDEDRILVIGATNRPYELDEAARRRLVKRLYIPLPELEARAQIVHNLLKSERHDLSTEDVYEIAKLADGYSGADMTNLCKEASMGPIRRIPFDQLEAISKEEVCRVTFQDFKEALSIIRPSVSQKDLHVYIDWDCTYGTASAHRT